MNDGRLIIDKTGDRVTSVQIDRELIEFARQNERVQRRLDAQERKDRAQRKRARRQYRARVRLVRRLTALAAVCGGVWAAWALGQVSLVLALIVSAGCLAVGAYRIGGARA